MIILAMDTTFQAMSVALLQRERVLAELYLDAGRRHEETLVPAVEQVLSCAGVVMSEVDLFACASGPGSFTGVRVGMGTAKGFARALNKPLAGVSSLEALAMNGVCSGMALCPMMDARRGEVYAALYKGEPEDNLEQIIPEQVTTPEKFIDRIEGDILFLGDGSQVYREIIQLKLRGRAQFTAPAAHRLSAANVGRIALKKTDGDDNLLQRDAEPRYLRPPYAGL